MRRREFIAGLGGAVTWPMAARAQQRDRVRRIGVLMAYNASDPMGKVQLSVLTRGLAELGWTEGYNLRMDVRWAVGNVALTERFAKELVDLRPDAILSQGNPVTAALQRETPTIPIVFAVIADPVSSGLVAGLLRPGGNLTGFIFVEAPIAGKWLELLTEIAPRVNRTAIMFNPDTSSGGGSFYPPSLEAAARSLNVTLIAAPVNSNADIETVITSLRREPRGGLIVISHVFSAAAPLPLIISLAARNNVPAVYGSSASVKGGGLLSYGPDTRDLFRRAAPYVDHILRGARPADLPIQLPVKFEMAVNLKTAKSLGLTVPRSILLSADEVIQ
jgi:putative ABC transport system substrate-binding protein